MGSTLVAPPVKTPLLLVLLEYTFKPPPVVNVNPSGSGASVLSLLSLFTATLPGLLGFINGVSGFKLS